MAVVTAVFNGQAQLINPFAAPLENRIATQLSEWYAVQDIVIKPQYDLLSFYFDFQATIRADTKNLPADAVSVAEKMKLATYLATGFVPSAVAVTSAGQVAPTAPEPGVLDSLTQWPTDIANLVRKLANGVGVTIETAKYLVIAIGLGLIALVYFIASNPGRAARVARG